MKLLLLCVLIVQAGFQDKDHSLTRLRKLYEQAAANRDSLVVLKYLLGGIVNTGRPVLVCYKGASSMMEAKYALNPIIKLKKFKAGKALMEEAIARDDSNLEMRLLRYTVQYNSPGMLGYQGNLGSDRAILTKAVLSVMDAELKQMIIHTLAVLH